MPARLAALLTFGDDDPGFLMMFLCASKGETSERRLDVSELWEEEPEDIGVRLSSTRQTLEPDYVEDIS